MSQNIILTQALNYLINKECMVDEDDDRQSLIYEFESTPSYVSLLSCNPSDPVYFVLVEKKGQATEKVQDRCGHVILRGELYLEGRYLHKSHSRHPNKRKRVKPLRNYKIGVVMLFFVANCILKVDICISPIHVIQTKEKGSSH